MTVNSADRLASLERLYGTPRSIPEKFDPDEECTVFPDGHAIAYCTNWARYVRRIQGADSCELYGFFSDAVPESSIARVHGGHDFAIVDRRYLVDAWLKEVDGTSAVAVFDLEDPANADVISRLYGPRAKWPRNFVLEQNVDGEPPEVRRDAMRGVKLWLATHRRKPRGWTGPTEASQ